MRLDRLRRRSVGFLERDDEVWSCFLVTYQTNSGDWRGYFSFRPRDGTVEDDEVRTADIFMEDSESRIDRKARGLGRPLLTGLLSSALHAHDRSGSLPHLRKWFRAMLRNDARKLAGKWEDERGNTADRDLDELQSIYASYRLDQVAHFIALVRPGDFDDAVERILEGTRFDFGAKDRLQFAMMVADFIEARLPLPPFEIWAEDYLANPEAYRLYSHTLHRAGRLP
ncbi:MAG: hypothetical protein WD013_01120 [Gemmatimonadota bacterium]